MGIHTMQDRHHHWIVWLTWLIVLAPRCPSAVAAQYPSYARHPVIIEYDVDPRWPQIPRDIGTRGWVSGIAVDDKDRVWLLKKGAHPVQVYTVSGRFVGSWGRGMFDQPHQLRIGPDGNIWIADFGLHIVQKFTPKGKLLQTLGVRGEKGADKTHFNMPTDIAITLAGDLFVTDGYGNRRVVHFDKAGHYVKEWGGYGTERGKFVLPHAIVVDKTGKLYVADRNSGRIQVFSQDGRVLAIWSNVIMPWGLSITADNDIWVCGSSPHWWFRHGVYPEYKDQVLMRFTTDGRLRQMWQIPLGDIGDDKNNPDVSRLKPGEAVGVHCIAADRAGNLYVGDIYGERAQKFVPVVKRSRD